ncbi:MAG: hypothetical protein JNN30_06605 [Rhodanobacteraceae bacterium]|nr:hypothetical protein [Rhodanobacteraceae bacterium]
MKVIICFSIFTSEPSAFGSANGVVELAATPVIGDAIWFLNPKPGVKMPTCGFGGSLLVENRSLAANAHERPLQVGLSDLNVPTVSDARAIADYFEQGFGLFVDVYSDRE